MKEHKHAEVFLAAARGEADDWEASCDGEKTFFQHASEYLESIYKHPEDWVVQRKQKTHVVNGFTVPEPLRDKPKTGKRYFVEGHSSLDFYMAFVWAEDSTDVVSFDRGVAHATKEGAIANCKARLGIDPYKDES